MTKDTLKESHFVDFNDQALKEHLGFLWEAAKKLKEAMKDDPEIDRLADALKTYKDDRYNNDIKRYTKLLRACRAVANLRGIKWDIKDDL